MFGYFGGDIDGHKGLDDEVGPEDVHHFEGGHHEHHEGIGELQDANLELGEEFADLGQGVGRGDDAYDDEEDYPARKPGDKSMDKQAVQKEFFTISVILC